MTRRRFTEQDKERLRDTDMEAILRAHGKDTSHTAGFLYRSPFREDNNPSFHIDHRNHRWADHGSIDPSSRKAGQKVAGGDTFDLVMRLRNCTFMEALEYLADFHPELYRGESEQIQTPQQSPSKIVIEEVKPSFFPFLMQYATQTRGIASQIVSRYCKQLNFHLTRGEESSRTYYAIGFPSMKGSWEIRNKYFKLSTGKAATIIDRDGKFRTQDDLSPTSDRVLVFEGFINFLSYLQDKRQLTPSSCDVVVLNSVSMLDSALDYIYNHERVIGYLDNDQTGKNYTAYLRDRCKERGLDFTDASREYAKVNDYNDLLLSKRSTQAKQRSGKQNSYRRYPSKG